MAHVNGGGERARTGVENVGVESMCEASEVRAATNIVWKAY
jgi:hypothetical protein